MIHWLCSTVVEVARLLPTTPILGFSDLISLLGAVNRNIALLKHLLK
jgi:hypothetical protein